MKNISLNILSLIVLASFLAFPQQFSTGSPEWLVDMFFNKNEFPNKANYFTGEMLNESNQPTIGEELNGSGEILFHQIKSTSDKIVFAVELKQEDSIIDFYYYLIKQADQWKISAVRRFLLPDFIYTVCDSLSKLDSLSPEDSTFYLTLNVFAMSDAELKIFLQNNLGKFEELISNFRNEVNVEIDKNLAAIGCNAIYYDTKYPGSVFIQIQSFENMESGFIFTDQSATLPIISEMNFIFIEEVIGGWYIFRRI